MTDKLFESRYHVGGMDCAATWIETAIGRLPGVSPAGPAFRSS